MSPTRWTWCSATAPGTAARWPTRSPRSLDRRGVGYVRLEASPDPVRVRAAYVTDADICAMAEAVGYLPGGGL